MGVVNDARPAGPRSPSVPMLCSVRGRDNYHGSESAVGVDRESSQIKADPRRAIGELDKLGTSFEPDDRARADWVVSLARVHADWIHRNIRHCGSLSGLFWAVRSVSYAVSRRTAELGLRHALSAHPRVVLWQTLRDSLAVVALGLSVGLPLSLRAGATD